MLWNQIAPLVTKAQSQFRLREYAEALRLLDEAKIKIMQAGKWANGDAKNLNTCALIEALRRRMEDHLEGVTF